MKGFKRYIRKKEVVERIRLIVPKGKVDELFDKIRDEGWHIKSCGPYTNSKMWPQHDGNRSTFVLERELS